MLDDFIINQNHIELNTVDLNIDNVIHSSSSSPSSSSSSSSLSSSYAISSVEIWALILTFLYYAIMICLGIFCWLNAKHDFIINQNHIELNTVDLNIDNVIHSSSSSPSSSSSSSSLSSSYAISSVEIWALILTFLYYAIMICLGIFCWLNAK
ncbi:uncharacterized protein DC041_0009123, partial [Schistosoma bovis]